MDLQELFGLNTKMIEQIFNKRASQIDYEEVYVVPTQNGSIFI
jgi:hypothetical protein